MKMRMSDSKGRRLHCWLAGASVFSIALLAGPAAAQEEEELPLEEEVSPTPEVEEDVAPAPMATAQAAPFTGEQVEFIRQAAAEAPKPFEYHGYLRSGFGTTMKGTGQVAFQAPGAYAKYRLGNETETYGEATFVANWLNPNEDGAWFKTATTLAYYTGNAQTFDHIVTPDPAVGIAGGVAVQEAFAEAGRVIEAAPEMTLWAGHRFYRRRDIHINDFYYFDMSGLGGGFQDLDVGAGKLSVAYLGATGLPPTQTANGTLAKNTLDVRLSGIDVGTGTLELWVNPVLARGDDVAAASRHGIAGGIVHTLGGFMGGFNELSVQFGYGGAANLSTYVPGSDEGWMLRVVERATIQSSEELSMMWGGVFQLDNTDGVDGANMWISGGVRPIYHFSDYTALAVEGGLDLVQPDGGDMGALAKVTVAPEIRAGKSFWARPTLRAFATAAYWTDPIVGQVGGAAFADDSFGMTFGVQMESWW